jgi:uncharacterized protein
VILPDVNVLLYAFRADSARHREYHDWLTAVVNADEPFGVSPQTLASLIRISTHPPIYVSPSRLDEAVAFCKAVVEAPTCIVVQPRERHWAIFTDLCRQAKVKGNLVQDAWFAALAIEADCEWITTDRDYARFPRLRWREPF